MSEAGSTARARTTILIADNDPEWLSLQKEALIKEGFQVRTAAKPAEAEHLLKSEKIDAAIFDIRLEDDNDDKDVSGLEVAERTPPSVGKVITTNFPYDMDTDQTFKERIGPESPVLSYVEKKEGIPAIVAALNKVAFFSVLSRSGPGLWDLVSGPSSHARARQSTRIAIILLLLALAFGMLAVWTGVMAWLFGTLVLAMGTVIFVGWAIE